MLRRYFSKIALDLLEAFYEDNPQYTHALLVGKVGDLDDLTPLQIAVKANFKAFISQPPVQKLLDKIWIKDIEKHSKHKYIPVSFSKEH